MVCSELPLYCACMAWAAPATLCVVLARTHPVYTAKIIGLNSIPTAVRYRIEDKEELESSM